MRNLQEQVKKSIWLPKIVLTFHCLNKCSSDLKNLPMSVRLKEDFFPDLRKIAMERPLQIIPNTAKVVHNTPCNIRCRNNSSSEREKKVCAVFPRIVSALE